MMVCTLVRELNINCLIHGIITSLPIMGNCIHTLLCKHGNKVTDVWSDDEASTEKIKESPQDAAEQKKTGTRRCIKITLTRKQLEQLLQQNPQGVSFQRKWKPSLQTIVEVDNF